ncbi:hypothetical protein [Anaeromicropila populeti]|uniref:Uncharacterized protein n=1 Tax=Anaeromicropila populeti TaxID=37658 RepID=A0A1I6IMN1_9FIRM|nr:hypothetical protein [Anaeromicropila populeti]SFR68027.1 hypothetical protein SAMN05661086_00917 [Anaeromicropila populeti]
MSFIIQRMDSMCGAYGLAYWKWMHFDEREPVDGELEGDYAYVKAIYAMIQFAGNAPKKELAQYSNPIDMMYWVKEQTIDHPVCFYTGGSPVINNIMDLMKVPNAPQKNLYDELIELGQIKTSSITLAEKQYAIMIFTVERLAKPTEDSEFPLFHTALTVRRDGQLYLINSWDGNERLITEDQFNGKDSISYPMDKLISTGAGIMLF